MKVNPSKQGLFRTKRRVIWVPGQYKPITFGFECHFCIQKDLGVSLLVISALLAVSGMPSEACSVLRYRCPTPCLDVPCPFCKKIHPGTLNNQVLFMDGHVDLWWNTTPFFYGSDLETSNWNVQAFEKFVDVSGAQDCSTFHPTIWKGVFNSQDFFQICLLFKAQDFSQSFKFSDHSSHENKKIGYFPLNPGCLIGILVLAYYKPHIIG